MKRFYAFSCKTQKIKRKKSNQKKWGYITNESMKFKFKNFNFNYNKR